MDTNNNRTRSGGPGRGEWSKAFAGRCANTAVRRCQGFSLAEMMVVMALLSVIVLGLYSVFSTTQRALRANSTQTDVLEAGRTALDAVSRELETAVPWGYRLPDGKGTYFLPHFYSQVAYLNPVTRRPHLQQLNDGTRITNILQECFFLSRSNNWWVGNGFFVASPTEGGLALATNAVQETGVGTLYRFTAQPSPPTIRLMPTNMVYLTNMFRAAKTNALLAFPVVDGIVHFRVRPVNSLGVIITNSWTPMLTNLATNPRLDSFLNPNVIALSDVAAGEYRTYFLSNSLPAFLELELGVVQPRVLQMMRSRSTFAAQRDFLTNQPGAVNLFRRLVPLRNAQP